MSGKAGSGGGGEGGMQQLTVGIRPDAPWSRLDNSIFCLVGPLAPPPSCLFIFSEF